MGRRELSLSLTDAYECAAIAYNAASRQEAWRRVEPRLLSEAGDMATMQFDIPASEAPKRNATKDEQFGPILSTEFEDFIHDQPETVTYGYIARRILNARSAFVIDTNDARQVTNVEIEQTCLERWRDFGFSNGLLVPLFNRAEGSLSLVLISNLRGASDDAANWPHSAAALQLSAAYFNEGLLLRERVKANDRKSILSPRERECLAWAGLGYTTSQIGDQLFLSDDTVNEYCRKAMKKLGAASRTQACARAFLLGVVESC